MQLLLNSLVILCVQFSVFSQMEFEEVRIYLFNEYRTQGFADSCTEIENYTRVNASIKISISDKNEIIEISDLLLRDRLKKCNNDGSIFNTQMVVDFISRGKVKKTFAISSSRKVRIDEDFDEVYILSTGSEVLFNKYLSFFREVQTLKE